LETTLDSIEAPGTHASWSLIAALTTLVGALALCFDRVQNGDLYLQLASGRFIADHGLVNTDPFPTIAQGGQWLNEQWLTELTFFHTFGEIGMTGLTVVYAMLLALPLGLLLWLCRHKGTPMLVAVAVLYFPGVLAIVHPRAAGFSLLGFSVLVVLIAISWNERPEGAGHRRQWLALLGILAVFALWANLHGGFIAGLLLIGLVCVGAAIDRWRGLPGVPSIRKVAMLGGIGVLAVAVISIATPLGGAIWDYILSFRNATISLATEEWGSVFGSPKAVVYLAIALAFVAWTWLRSARPRRATTLLVALGFIAFAAFSLRNIVFVGPVLALLVAWSAPNRAPTQLHLGKGVAAFAAFAAVAAIGVWVTILGPAEKDPHLRSAVVDYALAHPPSEGRIVAYAGVGSYILWRSPNTPVVLNGWLEHFTADDLRGTYGILRGWTADLPATAKRLQAGAVIAHVPQAIALLQKHGYVAEFTAPEGTYLVKRADIPRAPA
jgi:MFS family permease